MKRVSWARLMGSDRRRLDLRIGGRMSDGLSRRAKHGVAMIVTPFFWAHGKTAHQAVYCAAYSFA